MIEFSIQVVGLLVLYACLFALFIFNIFINSFFTGPLGELNDSTKFIASALLTVSIIGMMLLVFYELILWAFSIFFLIVGIGFVFFNGSIYAGKIANNIKVF